MATQKKLGTDAERKMLRERIKKIDPSKEGRLEMHREFLKVLEGQKGLQQRELEDEQKILLLKQYLKKKQESKDNEETMQLFFGDDDDQPPHKKPKLDKQPQQSEPAEEIDDCKCDEIDDGGECEQCERKSNKALDEFEEPHYRKFKAYIDDTRELVRDKNGNLPEWWERFEMARSDEHCHFVMEKFNQSTD